MIIRTGDLPTALNPQNRNQTNETINETKQDSTNIASASNTIKNELDNSKKVEEIKEKVNDGSYKIDIKKTADKMAQDLLLSINVYK